MELAEGVQVRSRDGESTDGVDILDEGSNLTWTIRFFDNLHMDLRKSMRSHLEQAVNK